MARHKSSKFRSEMTKPPYDLDLNEDEGAEEDVVYFQDPGRMSLKDARELAGNQDIAAQIGVLLEDPKEPESTEQFDRFWAAWENRPIADVQLLMEDIQTYYGVGSGK